MSTAQSIFSQIFRSIGGGKRIAVLIGAYFDESAEGSAKDGLLSISGYVLDEAAIEGLIQEWRKMLHCYQLPYFHMAECNAHCGIYGHLDENGCDQCARESIRIARAYALHGHSFVLDQSEYRQILQDRGFDCDPYTFMVWNAYIHVNRWVHENRPDEKISLFFERGYETQARANELLQAVSQDEWRGKNRLASFTFVKKENSEPTQAADLIAWHVRKGYENIRCGKPIRKDTQALIDGKKILTIEWTSERLVSLRDEFTAKAGNLENAARTMFSRAT